MAARPVRLARRTLVAVCALVLPVVSGTAAVAQDADPQVVRVDGADRYETAARVSESFMTGVERVFLATGEDFPDALAAGPVAGLEGFPILLVERDRIPAPTVQALERLDPAAITVLGGTVAVSDAVVRQARDHTSGPVDRLAGDDRYDTAAAVVDQYVDPGVPVAYVATGRGFADALAGGPAAIADGGPMLLVEPNAIPLSTRTTLERLRPERLVLLGGTQVVSRAVEEDLEDLTGVAVQRMAGADRYGTAARVAREVFDGAEPTVHMTTGQAFPDALAGGVVAGMEGAPLVTVDPRCVPDVVLSEVDRMDPDTLVVLGGTQAVSRTAAELTPCSELGPATATTVQAGLDAPWDVTWLDGRAFVTERDSGVVSVLEGGRARPIVTFGVDNGGEGGLLGLETVGDRLYAMYVDAAAQDQRIVSFRADGSDVRPVVTGLPRSESSNHFGGRIALGPDGLLYVALGDMSNPSRSQDLDDPAGSILRYRVDGTPAGVVDGAHPALYASGFRDPQGITWDGAGRMYVAEFGQNTQDEVDHVLPGRNYGWPIMEGDVPYRGGSLPPGYHAPIFTAHPDQASWSGLTALVGGDVPDWEGDLFVAALRGQRLYRIDLDGAGNVAGSQQLLVGQYGRLRHATQAPDGSLWVLTSNCDGRGSCPGGDDDRIVRLGM